MGTTNAANIRAQFDASRAGLQTAFSAGDSDNGLTFDVSSLTTATAEALRSLEFVAPDDLELRVLGLSADHGAITNVVTCTLTQQDVGTVTTPTVYILDEDWVVSLTCSGSAEEEFARQAYMTTSGSRLMLKRGVAYKLTLATDGGTITRATGTIYWRVKRRTS